MVMWTNVCITTIEKRVVNGMVNCKSVEEEILVRKGSNTNMI